MISAAGFDLAACSAQVEKIPRPASGVDMNLFS